MAQFIYKGFNVKYNISSSEGNPAFYKADGYVIPPNEKNSSAKQKFHTEYPTREGAQQEIEKLLKDYIDFEWEEFKEMRSEK